jgi:hypothetical protein
MRSSVEHRDFSGRVILIALLRVAHIVGVVGVGAAVLREEAAGALFPLLLVGGGLGIAALDRWSNRAFLHQVSGLVVVLKAVALAALALLGWLGAGAFWTILVFSVVVAHAPGRLRHRRIL